MKTTALFAPLFVLLAASAQAQGPLTPPPGAPAPVMKSLDQLEARTPLMAGQPGVTVSPTGEITITANGSYYLTANLNSINNGASCINVGSYNVMLDLNGFTVSRATGSESGTAAILVSGVPHQKVMIRNGFIVGGGTAFGFAAAIDITNSTTGGVHVENVHCSKVRSGIILNYEEGRNSVRNCSVETSGGEGIRAEIVVDCTVRDTVSSGIFGQSVSGCSVVQSAVAFPGGGIVPISNVRSVVINCNATSYSGIGIQATSVTNSHAGSATGPAALSASVATNCTATRNGGTAIIATIANGCWAISGAESITHKYNMP